MSKVYADLPSNLCTVSLTPPGTNLLAHILRRGEALYLEEVVDVRNKNPSPHPSMRGGAMQECG